MKLALNRTTTKPRKGPSPRNKLEARRVATEKARQDAIKAEAEDLLTRDWTGHTQRYKRYMLDCSPFIRDLISGLPPKVRSVPDWYEWRKAEALQGPQLPTPKPMGYWKAIWNLIFNPKELLK